MKSLRALCRESARDLGYWLAAPASLAFHESRADHSLSYHPETIPPPLLIGDDSPQHPNPRRLYLIGEQAIRRGTGLEQALKLLLLADLPHLTIRAVPGGEIFGGAFQILEFLTHPPLVHVSGHHIGLTLEHETFTHEYQNLATQITQVALSPSDTRDLLVELAAYAQVG
jgi:hypothetical protein